MKSKKPFTLLEVMIAVLLLAIAAGAIGLRMGKSLEERRFQAARDRLHLELELCRFQALNQQADVIVVLEKSQERIRFKQSCPEMATEKVFHWDGPGQFLWNGEPMQTGIFYFYATGTIHPSGRFEWVHGNRRASWDIPGCFAYSEGEKKMLRPRESIQ